jgi:hypothetical protein
MFDNDNSNKFGEKETDEKKKKKINMKDVFEIPKGKLSKFIKKEKIHENKKKKQSEKLENKNKLGHLKASPEDRKRIEELKSGKKR